MSCWFRTGSGLRSSWTFSAPSWRVSCAVRRSACPLNQSPMFPEVLDMDELERRLREARHRSIRRTQARPDRTDGIVAAGPGATLRRPMSEWDTNGAADGHHDRFR